MKLVWLAGQLLFLVFAVASMITKPNMANEYMILSFEMAILFRLEGE